jgi:23S rRNA pseudouridine1911/1915/1917 synthase
MVLGETSALRFLWKPPGLPVFPPHDQPDGDCVLKRYLLDYPHAEQGFPNGFAGGIAHRLDTLTSGIVVAAKGPVELQAVRADWSNLRKFYRFYSEAPAEFEHQVVEAPIAHHAKKAKRVVVGGRGPHRGQWRAARTVFSRLGEGWWQAEIRSGALHQVRAHAAFLGIALDGDPLYGKRAGTPQLIHVGIVAAGWSFWLPNPPGPAR